MSTVAKDITGKRVGALVALRPTSDRINNCVAWECRCDCGKTVKIPTGLFNYGRIKSCGCGFHRKTIEHNGERYNFVEFAKKYGLSASLVRERWARGIRGDELVLPPRKLPSSCISQKATIYYDSDGSPIHFSELAKEVGVSRWGLMLRYFKGKRGEELRKPSFYYLDNMRTAKKRTPYKYKFMYQGKEMGIGEISKLTGVLRATLYTRARTKKCTTVEELLSPIRKNARGKSVTEKAPRKCKHMADYNGEHIGIAEIARRTGISYRTLMQRYLCGVRGKSLVYKAKEETNG